MTNFQHGVRISLLLVLTGAILLWGLRHSETNLSDGLKAIRQAKLIERGEWSLGLIDGIDHPLHPLGIAWAHRLIGVEDAIGWQRAASALSFACLALLVIPVYLFARDVYGDRPAWLGTALVMTTPVLSSIAANVVSESTFLLFWTWGLRSAVRYLQEGRPGWLYRVVMFGFLAYMARPEGLLLPLILTCTLALLPFLKVNRVNWPQWCRSLAILILGTIAISSPFMVAKGGLATRPGSSRVLGLAPHSPPEALERERPLPPDQSLIETYSLATGRMVSVIRAVTPTVLLPFALLGLVFAIRNPEARTARGLIVDGSGTRVWLFLSLILGASAIGLVRLHVTGGYCDARHGLVPGMILLTAAGYGLVTVVGRVSIEGRVIGLPQVRLRPGPAIWAALLVFLIATPRWNDPRSWVPGPFNTYRDTGTWLAENVRGEDLVLDLTNWARYFSGRDGYDFAQVHEAPLDPRTRWLVLRQDQVNGSGQYQTSLRKLIAGMQPKLLIPPLPGPGQIQLGIYDLHSFPTQVATWGSRQKK